MDLRQLRYFLVVADELSFTRAARRLNISQPPLSQQIQQLEAQLGTKLLNRTSRRVELTAAGAELQTQARAILAQTEQARQQVRFIGAGRSGKIDIGATGAILRGGLAELLADYRRGMPDVRTTIHEQAPALQVKAVIEYRTDISFNRSVASQEELASALAWREEVWVILPKGHRLARRSVVPLAELRDDDHVMLHPDSSEFARGLQTACVDAGFLPRISQQVVDSQSIPSLIAAGFGVSLVPASTAKFTSNDVIFRPVKPVIVADVYMVYRRNEPSQAVLEFVRWAQAEMAKRVGGPGG
ncbi:MULTISPECIES: LysR substrate-binding domain-containing protein [Rhodomicrobium]|uniref:LysR substrate-binding domain-containing protein n=1 Tax=Rhodomicrobium TaxID=1068 RepID=UPI000B4A792A|nr:MULTISPECIES: LysR substrate-binding domain-containing protein [Rhodomicrobium]